MISSFQRLCMHAAMVGLVLGAHTARAQTMEDHSLPRSAIKTYHVKCSSGRLGMIRFDTRQESPRICASVQDGSRPQTCVIASKAQTPQTLNDLAKGVCQ